VNEVQKKQAKQEFALHCSLKHENIVKAYEWSENDSEYIMLMEYMNKPDYFREKIDVNLNPIKSEEKMKSYMSNVLEGLDYVHTDGIVHCDMKLENLLVHAPEEGENDGIPIVKVCDFGISHLLNPENGKFYMEVKSGTHSYLAPEIKQGAYLDEKIDMWALGIILYKMAVAYKPTQIAGYKYGGGPIPFRKIDWKKRSPELQDLITRMLDTEPEKRPSTKDCLQHQWFAV